MVSDCLRKLNILNRGAVFDMTCADDNPDPNQIAYLLGKKILSDTPSERMPAIAHVNNCGRPMPVLKVLQTSHCQFNCNYCAFRKDSDYERESLTSAELADTTAQMTKSGLIEGLFLSSGIGENVSHTMTRIIDTARILREKHLYNGYLHLKILPGSSVDLIEAAGKYADRLSINMEAPSESALQDIAPNKSIKSAILKQMQAIETLRRQGRIPRRVGQTTQFVVGGSDDPGANDRALITAADYLYRQLDFRRVYYSRFNPIPGTPLEDRSPENPARSFRLYQADRLVALYDFKPEEFIFDAAGKFDLDKDPKEMWADAHPEMFPIEINTADPSILVRIPGIGPLTAKKILKARCNGGIKSVEEYLKLGRIGQKSLKYILINGRSPLIPSPSVSKWNVNQLELPFGGTKGLLIPAAI